MRTKIGNIVVFMLLVFCCASPLARAQQADTVSHKERVVHTAKAVTQPRTFPNHGLTQGQAEAYHAVPLRKMTVTETPHFPGGADSLQAFMARHLRYPEEARDKKIQGVVTLSFVVDTDGAVSNIRIRQDIGGGCAAEAVRVVAAMPYWVPARNAAGRRVRVETVVPVRFALDNLVPDDVDLSPEAAGTAHSEIPECYEKEDFPEHATDPAKQ